MADRSEFDLYETSFASPDEISSDYSPEDLSTKDLSAKDSSASNLQTESSVLLPSAEFLTDAALVRQNEDLVLRLPDGREMVVEGYFAADPRPTLTLADSDRADSNLVEGAAVLTPELVQSFLQERIFAGEGSATATDSITNSATNSQGSAIGNAETVIGEAIVLRAGQKIPLEAGDPVFEGDIIETETGGSAKLRFIDETVFSISEEARMALDKMVFNPETEQGETVLSMLKGGFLFVSGLIAKTDPSDMQVVTPVATIGIRGTIVTGTINPGEAFEFSVIDGAIAVQPQGADEPIVMDNAFATLGGSISENGEITTRISQDSAREVIERNAGQFATLSDADVAVIETAVAATAVQNGETVTLDLPDLIEEIIAEITATDEAEDQDAVLESPVEPIDTTPATETDETGDIDLEPVEEPVVVTVVEPEPEPEPEPDDPEPEPDPVVAVDPLVIFALTGVIGRANAILSGTAQAGATIEVVGTLNGVEEPALTTTATGGNWSVDLGADSSFNPDNVIYTYSVTATDAAGTTLDSATTDVQLDFVAPAAPTLDTPTLDSNGYIDKNDLTLSGTSTETDTVTVTLTGADNSTVVYENVAVDSTTREWSLDLATASATSGTLNTTDGEYTVIASASDAAGNSADSSSAQIKIDHVDPTVTIDQASNTTLNGASSILTGSVSEDETTVTVTFYNNGATDATETATVTDNGDGTYSWSLDLSNIGLDTSGATKYDISVTAADTAGNTGSALVYLVAFDFSVSLSNASLAATGDENALSVSGNSAEVGAIVTVDLMDANDNIVESGQTATVDANGNWSVTFSDVLSGTYKASVTATDTVGNTTENPLTTASSYVAIYKEDWSNLTAARSVDYSSTHTAGSGVEITTSSQADTIITTDDNDIITSSSGNDTIDTSAGDDEITLTYENYASGTPPTYLVNAGEGNDTLIVSDQAFDIYYEVNTDGSHTAGFDGGGGDDTLVIHKGDSTVEKTGFIPIKGFETIILVADTEYVSTDAQKKLTMTDSAADSEQYYTPQASFDLSSEYDLTLEGRIIAVDTVTIENGMDAVWKDSNIYNGSTHTKEATKFGEVTLSAGTEADNTELTLQANQSLDTSAYYFEATNSFTLEANTTLTLQANDNGSEAGDADMSNLLKVGGGSAENDKFVMDQDAKLVIDFLNLETNDLAYAKNVLDLTGVDADDSAEYLGLAGTLVIQANAGIFNTESDPQTIIAIANDAKDNKYNTFDEILFLDGSENNLVTTGTAKALVPIFDMTDTEGTNDYGLKLKTVTAEEYTHGVTELKTDGAYYSTTGQKLEFLVSEDTNNSTEVSLYGANDAADTFVISSANQLAYFDGGSGGHNDTLKITGTEAIQFYDVYSDTGIMDFQVNRIETLDISENDGYDAVGGALALSVAFVKALTEDTNSVLEEESVEDFSHSLILKVGSGEDSINRFDAAGSGWTEDTDASNATNYTVYTQDDARIYVDAT